MPSRLSKRRADFLIKALVQHMARADEEAEKQIPVILEEVIGSEDTTVAVLAEQAVVAFRAAMGTDVHKTPRLWARRFNRFIDLTELIFKEVNHTPKFFQKIKLDKRARLGVQFTE